MSTTVSPHHRYLQETFDHLLGARITDVRPATTEECAALGWDDHDQRNSVAFVLTHPGQPVRVLIASRDPEGNGAGFAFVLGPEALRDGAL